MAISSSGFAEILVQENLRACGPRNDGRGLRISRFLFLRVRRKVSGGSVTLPYMEQPARVMGWLYLFALDLALSGLDIDALFALSGGFEGSIGIDLDMGKARRF